MFFIVDSFIIGFSYKGIIKRGLYFSMKVNILFWWFEMKCKMEKLVAIKEFLLIDWKDLGVNVWYGESFKVNSFVKE